MEAIKEGAVNIRPVGWENITRDAQNVVKWANDRSVKNALKYFSFFQDEITLGRQLQYFSRMIANSANKIFIIETKSGTFLGTCGLHDIDEANNNLRIGIIIFNKHYWRKGYGRLALNLLLMFAFGQLNMNKVYLTARIDNELAIHVYKSFGFQEEGAMRQEYKVGEGRYIDLLRMSILKSEFIS